MTGTVIFTYLEKSLTGIVISLKLSYWFNVNFRIVIMVYLLACYSMAFIELNYSNVIPMVTDVFSFDILPCFNLQIVDGKIPPVKG